MVRDLRPLAEDEVNDVLYEVKGLLDSTHGDAILINPCIVLSLIATIRDRESKIK